MRAVWLLAVMLGIWLGAAACGGDGGGSSETPTVPTIDAAQQGTQAAINTEEAGAVPTATRVAAPATAATPASGTLALATTGELVESGLIETLVSRFEEESGYTVAIAASDAGGVAAAAALAGTDVLLMDDGDRAAALVTAGDARGQTLVMHTELVIAGPADDPADAGAQETAHDVFQQIAANGLPFVSRGGATGVAAVEAQVWASAQISPAGEAWYEASGLTAPLALAAASGANAYTLTDMGSYLRAPGALQVVFRGDLALVNEYYVLVVSPERHPAVNVAGAEAFAAFIARADIQQIIGEFGAAELGEAVFLPDAG